MDWGIDGVVLSFSVVPGKFALEMIDYSSHVGTEYSVSTTYHPIGFPSWGLTHLVPYSVPIRCIGYNILSFLSLPYTRTRYVG